MEEKGVEIAVNGLVKVLGFLFVAAITAGVGGAIGRRIANKALNKLPVLGEA